MNLAIIDYGAGNTANVRNAFQKIGCTAKVSSKGKDLEKADALVLPGVGAFGSAMNRLNKENVNIGQLVLDGKPFLGICLGMQLLLESSEETPGVAGFGLIKGNVKKFRTALPVPQIGWNRVVVKGSPLFAGLKDFQAYFLHSYYCNPEDKSLIFGTTKYGIKFASAVWKKNMFGTQFHPEKSGEIGLLILRNFINEVKK